MLKLAVTVGLCYNQEASMPFLAGGVSLPAIFYGD